MRIYNLIPIWLIFSTLPVFAESLPPEFGGYVKYQGVYLDSQDLYYNHLVDSRITMEQESAIIDSEVHAQFLSVTSNFNQSNTQSFELIPSDRKRIFRLTHAFDDKGGDQQAIRLDRAALGISTQSWKVSAGRQAISIGKGLVFQSLDVFNPFSPVAIDKEFKPGDDSFLARLNTSTNSSISALIVGRRNDISQEIEEDEASFLIRSEFRFDGGDAELLAARHYGDPMFGIGAAEDFYGATVRADLALRSVLDESFKSSFVLNIDRGFEIFNHNAYGFAEFFHSGLGNSEDAPLLPSDTASILISRGELFTIQRNYFAYGGRIELSPLVSFYLSLISNLQDKSSIVQPSLWYSVSDSVQVKAGGILPLGGQDEFSSRSAGSGPLRSKSYFVRLEYYF